MEPLGKKLKEFRWEQGLSKRALVKILGVSVPTLTPWDEVEPRGCNLHKILRLLEKGLPTK